MKPRAELRLFDQICPQGPTVTCFAQDQGGSQHMGLGVFKVGQSPAKRGDKLATLCLGHV